MNINKSTWRNRAAGAGFSISSATLAVVLAACPAWALDPAAAPPPMSQVGEPLSAPTFSPLAQPAVRPAGKAQGDVIQAGEDAAARLTAPVMINGQGPFSFIVDTGAQRSVLADDLAARLSLAPGDPIRVHGVAGQVIAAGARVARLEVGTRALVDVDLPLLSRHDIGADGVLGIDALQGQTVLLDFVHSKIFVRASTPEHHASDEIVVRAKSRFGQLILVDSSFANDPVLVVIDTGAEASIANLSLQTLIERRHQESIGMTDIVSVTGQKTKGDWRVTPEFRVGGVNISNLPVIFSDLHSFKIWKLDDQPSMLLGMDVLRQFSTVEIDFLRREVRFHVPSTGLPAARVGA